jgi:hypothetical protein
VHRKIFRENTGEHVFRKDVTELTLSRAFRISEQGHQS